MTPAKKKQVAEVKGGAGTPPAPLPSSIDKLIARGNKAFGDGVFKRLEEDPSHVKQRLDTGLVALNVALSGKRDGGIPTGRITTIYGSESVGKTTLGMMLMKSVQDAGGRAFVIDTEATLESGRAQELGVDVHNTVYIDEGFLEPCLDAVMMAITAMKKTLGILFFDTIAGTPSVHDKGRNNQDNSRISIHSLSLGKGMRAMSGPLSKSNFIVLLCNQLKTGGIGNAYASERERNAMLGGKPIRFHSHIIIRIEYLRKFRVIHNGQKLSRGFEVRVTIEKNKSNVPDVVLNLVFASYNNGKFDDALSALATLRAWGAIPKAAEGQTTISFNGAKVSAKKWRTLYETDKQFKESVCAALETAFHERYHQV